MPVSIVLLLSSSSSIPQGNFARQAQAWFLDRVRRKDPGLAEALHQQSRFKPYTVSDLLPVTIGKKAHGLYSAGTMRYLRFTLLEDTLAQVIWDGSSTASPLFTTGEQCTLDGIAMTIEDIAFTQNQHPLADSTSYAGIVQRAMARRQPKQVCLEFLSPTNIRHRNLDFPLPLPGGVFRSLSERWNAFCPEELQIREDWQFFADDCICIRSLKNINTQRLAHAGGSRGYETGFTGKAEFGLLSPKKAPQYPPEAWEGGEQIMRALAEFAFYAGVGHHTTWGMGQVRPLLQEGMEIDEATR